jgi:hypothetical protein
VSKPIAISFVCSFAALITIGEAAAAPLKELYGKSISVFWFESGAQNNGSQRGRPQNLQIDVYVSTAGRIFSRLVATLGNHRGFVGFNARPNAAAEQGPESGGAKVGNVDFAGHSLIMTSVFESGARRISVEFDEPFASCQAKVMYGKEAGHSTIRQPNMFGGQTVEIGAIQISGVGCTVRQGNVFTQS